MNSLKILLYTYKADYPRLWDARVSSLELTNLFYPILGPMQKNWSLVHFL
jgi:hypothetical protein